MYIEWMEEAICRQVDPEAMFPESGKGQTHAARQVCQTGPCPVMEQCLVYALEHNERGVWGGMTERARRRMRGVHPADVDWRRVVGVMFDRVA